MLEKRRAIPVRFASGAPREEKGLRVFWGTGGAAADGKRVFTQRLGLEVNRRDLPQILPVKDISSLDSLFNHFVFSLRFFTPLEIIELTHVFFPSGK